MNSIRYAIRHKPTGKLLAFSTETFRLYVPIYNNSIFLWTVPSHELARLAIEEVRTKNDSVYESPFHNIDKTELELVKLELTY